MATFDEREKAFEAKYARDEEVKFKVAARRNKLLGLWAAELMGLTGDGAQNYAREVVKADFREAGEEDVFAKVKGDLAAKGVAVSDHRIRRAMSELLAKAERQIEAEVK